jgi:hypothetical protein
MFQHLGIGKPEPAAAAYRRYDENIGKIGNIFRLIQVFYLSIA